MKRIKVSISDLNGRWLIWPFIGAALVIALFFSQPAPISQAAEQFNENSAINGENVCPPTFARIMPLGDSITRGYGSGDIPTNHAYNVGYRRPLFLSLTSNGYDFDFVGSLQNGQLSSGPLFDYDHQGPGGVNSSQIRTEVTGYLGNNPADIVLLHIGTNDLVQNRLPAAIAADIEGILDNIHTVDPNIFIILAQIVDWFPNDARITDLNNLIATLANEHDNVILVNMQAALNYPDDIFIDLDGRAIHPNESGYGKMAAVWYDALAEIMDPCVQFAPTIISQPVTSGAIGLPYLYTVEALAEPAPTFSLTTSPLGMVINATTGLVEWTPTAAGNYNVTLSATNSQGSDFQSFTIIVPISPLPAVCRSDAASYWKLDEISGTVFGDSNGLNSGSCTGVTCPTPDGGRVNGAQSFSGSGSDATRILIPHDASLNVGGSFSIAAWININSCNDQNVAVSKWSDGGSSWWLGCDNNQTAFSLRDSNAISSRITYTETLTAAQWYHLVGVRDGTANDGAGENRFYVNGAEVGDSAPTYTGSFNNGEPLRFGIHANEEFAFQGLIDEVALFQRALDPTEVARQYAAGLIGLGYDADNWTVNSGQWTDDTRWYGNVPGAGDYAVVQGANAVVLTGDTAVACLDVTADSVIDLEIHNLSVDGAFNNDGLIEQTKQVNANQTVNFFHISGAAGTIYRGAQITAGSTPLGPVTVAIYAPDSVGDGCTGDPDSPPYAERCFEITGPTDITATVRLYAANPAELNGIAPSALRPYRFNAGWQPLTNGLTTGEENGFAYAQAVTPGFSYFLLGGSGAPTAVTLQTITVSSSNLTAVIALTLTALLLITFTGFALRRRGFSDGGRPTADRRPPR